MSAARRRILVALAVAVPFAVAALLPGAGPPTTGGLPWDKLLHAAGCATIVAAGTWATRRDDPRTLLALVALVSLYGGGVELAQAFVPSRHPSLLDFAADVAGACLGALAVRLRAVRAQR